MYAISFHVDIALIVQQFLSEKEIAVKYFSKIFDIYIPILVTKVLAEVLIV